MAGYTPEPKHRSRLRSRLGAAWYGTLRRLKDVDMALQRSKVVNLKLAAERLDGLLIHPSETFSYWRCIGNPCRRRGFVEGGRHA